MMRRAAVIVRAGSEGLRGGVKAALRFIGMSVVSPPAILAPVRPRAGLRVFARAVPILPHRYRKY